jgi:hypothetical protein
MAICGGRYVLTGGSGQWSWLFYFSWILANCLTVHANFVDLSDIYIFIISCYKLNII